MSQTAPTGAGSLIEQALQHHRDHNLAAAETCYRALLANDPYDVDGVSYLALLYMQQQRADAALALLHSTLAQQPHVIRWLVNLGQFEQQLGNFTAAETAFRQALAIEPLLLDARLRLGQVIAAQLDPGAMYPAQKISVLVPSRLDKHPVLQTYWLEQAVQTILQQTVFENIALEICVGIDHGTLVPPALARLPLRFAPAAADAPRNQAAALNAAAQIATGDVFAFMEDDDMWDPRRLALGLRYLTRFDFISSNQLEITPEHVPVVINDYATPSGWLMTRQLWDKIGAMDDSFKWHLDGEWLGRLNASGAARCHLVDNQAPTALAEIQAQRSYLLNIITTAPLGGAIINTGLPQPLVYRTVHLNSGMATIAQDTAANDISKAEDARIINKYGHLPC